MPSLDEAMEAAGAAAFVMYASSADPNFRYLTGFVTGDPMFYIRKRGEAGFLIVPQMEAGRAKGEAVCDIITRGEAGYFELLEEEQDPKRAAARMVHRLAGGDILVPGTFPLGIARAYEPFGAVTPESGVLDGMRAVTTAKELDAIRASQAVTNEVMAYAAGIIAGAAISAGGDLVHDGEPLTSEGLRREMHCWLLRRGYAAHETIISCGPETAQPHNTGSGTLVANEPIVIDVFPRDEATGYYADMSRTFCRGEPSKEIRDIYAAVRDAQTLAEGMIRPGITGAAVHGAVVDLFKERGYATGAEGFIHSLGHGVGLAIHEDPYLSPRGDTELAPGHVVTVEPGLYYTGIGGVRLEDLGAVTQDGFEVFTNYERTLIL